MGATTTTRLVRRTLTFAGVAIVLLVAPAAASALVTETPIPTSFSRPQSIAAGPDGALWFTEFGGDKIGRITTAGAITEFQLTAGSQPDGIAAGPDGALWFTEFGTDRIGRITTGGAITETATPT